MICVYMYLQHLLGYSLQSLVAAHRLTEKFANFSTMIPFCRQRVALQQSLATFYQLELLDKSI